MVNFKFHSFIFQILLFSLFGFAFVSCGNKGKTLRDGTYNVQVTLEGGSGRSKVVNPNVLFVKNGKAFIKLVWASKNYDYMIVSGEKYFNENPDGNSSFTFPVSDVFKPLTVIADTIAMSVPHEVEYVLYFDVLLDDEGLISGLGKNGEKEDGIFHNSLISENVYSKNNEVDFCDIVFNEDIELKFAKKFSIKKSDSYSLINIVNGQSFLVVGENAFIPKNCPKDLIILKKPFNNTYLVSTSVMDFFVKLGIIENIKFSGTKAKDWYIPEAVSFMKQNKILYAGKYSSPDYELLYSSGCNLAIENTMIFHKPEVIEKLNELGIPVLIEQSVYEEHPLGRLEWIKLYGVLFGKEREAENFFDEQVMRLNEISNNSFTGKSVAFFYVTSNGSVNIRKPNDYISKMINLSGGNYIFNNLSFVEDNSLSTMNMQFEKFYLDAKDADIIIYNSTIDGKLNSINELLEKNSLFADFKAVKSGKVYCTENNFFQESCGFLDFIYDVNKVCNNFENDFYYLCKVE